MTVVFILARIVVRIYCSRDLFSSLKDVNIFFFYQLKVEAVNQPVKLDAKK